MILALTSPQLRATQCAKAKTILKPTVEGAAQMLFTPQVRGQASRQGAAAPTPRWLRRWALPGRVGRCAVAEDVHTVRSGVLGVPPAVTVWPVLPFPSLPPWPSLSPAGARPTLHVRNCNRMLLHACGHNAVPRCCVARLLLVSTLQTFRMWCHARGLDQGGQPSPSH